MFGYYLDLALRRCRQSPVMVGLLVLTLAIGIGSCMTALTVFRALSGQPLPGVSNHLYVVTMDARGTGARDTDLYDEPESLLSERDAKALVHARRAPRQIALAQSLTRIATPDGKHAGRDFGYLGYGPMLATLGVPLRHGRPWTVAEAKAHDPVIVINTTLAERLYGKTDVVGRSVTLGSRSFRVVGVMAPWKPRMQFVGLRSDRGGKLGHDVMFFVPAGAALAAGVGPVRAGKCPKHSARFRFQSAKVTDCRWLEVWVALDTPAQRAQYRSFLTGYAQAQHAAGRFVHEPHARLYGTLAWMDMHHVVPGNVSLNALLAGAFLLLCMVNVAGLLAARFLRRRVDVAVRRALGASRRHVFGQHLVESAMLGLAGGVLALPLTLLGLWIVRMQPVSYAPAAHFSVPVFVALVVLSLIVGVIVGILPAWRVCRQSPAMQVKLG